MKIVGIETFTVDAGWRPWIFVKVETDEGVTGYGECSDGRSPLAVVGAVEDMKPVLIGTDPRAYEMRFWDMLRSARQSPGGILAKAIAGVELALIDIKAKALGISAVELFGGPTRESVRVYWSHCGSTRARMSDILGTPPIRTMADISELGREVVRRGYTALKTNIVIPGDSPSVWIAGFGVGPGTTDQIVTRQLLRHIEELIGTFRDAVGPDVDINLDLTIRLIWAFQFRLQLQDRGRDAHSQSPGAVRSAVARDRYVRSEGDLADQGVDDDQDMHRGESLLHEGLYSLLRPARRRRFMIDLPWNGFSQAKKIADLAEVYQLNIAPHNYYSHLATFISASLCAVVPNVRIMETEVDDVPWKDDLTTNGPEIINGEMTVPSGPGWGTELVEEVAREHPWHRPRAIW